MNYIIILTPQDVEFIANRAVICSVGDNLAIFEPIPTELELYFDGRERLAYIPDWAFPERPIRVTIPNELVTRAQVAAAAATGDTLDALGQIINAVYPAHGAYIVVSDVNASIYLNYILPEHEQILLSFAEITIEYQQEGEINIV